MLKKRKFIAFLIISLVFFMIAITVLFSKNLIQKSPSCFFTSEIFRVKMRENGFQPNIFAIKKCTTVIFENEGRIPHWPASDLHPTHGIYPEFDPKMEIQSNKSWSFVFEKPGTWRYHDHLNPFMHGVITVTP